LSHWLSFVDDHWWSWSLSFYCQYYILPFVSIRHLLLQSFSTIFHD
jgi:hypothetical protein